jgi:hypothetical protein
MSHLRPFNERALRADHCHHRGAPPAVHAPVRPRHNILIGYPKFTWEGIGASVLSTPAHHPLSAPRGLQDKAALARNFTSAAGSNQANIRPRAGALCDEQWSGIAAGPIRSGSRVLRRPSDPDRSVTRAWIRDSVLRRHVPATKPQCVTKTPLSFSTARISTGDVRLAQEPARKNPRMLLSFSSVFDVAASVA